MMLKKIVLPVLFISLLSILACKNTSHNHDHQDHDHAVLEGKIDKTGPEYTSDYVCPMHCEGSGGEEAGDCPVCSMAYVPKEEIKDHDHHNCNDPSHNHDHDHDHDDHDHDHPHDHPHDHDH